MSQWAPAVLAQADSDALVLDLSGRQRNGGGSHRPPKDNPASMPAGGRNEKGTPYSLALNSIWNRRGSLYDAV